MFDLVQKEQRPPGFNEERSVDRAVDSPGKARLKAELEDVLELLEEAKRCGNEERIDELEVQKQGLVRQLNSDVGLGGRPHDINCINPTLRSNIRSALNRAVEKLELASPPMPKAAQHFRDYIRADGPTYIYQPPAALPWVFDRIPLL